MCVVSKKCLTLQANSIHLSVKINSQLIFKQMKKVYLMKGMAAMALGLVVASCNKFDAFNPYAEQEAKQQEFTENFQTSVMNGQAIDQNQTWATTTPVQVSVTPSTTGTLKIYTANPIGNVVASLYTADVTAGTKTTFTVAKPADVSKLYAAVINTKGLISDMLAFDATDNAEVNFNATTSNRAARRAAPARPTQPSAPAKSTLREPTDMPTAESAQNKILSDATYDWGFNIDGTYYIAPGVTVTIGANGSLNQRTKIYMGAGSKIVKEGELWLDDSSVLYNDGGTIEATNFVVNKGVLWNKGKIALSGILSASNDNAQIYNAANDTIKAAGISLSNNSQLLWNDGVLDIDGDIQYYNADATIVNDGKIIAENMFGRAGGSLFNLEDRVVEIADSTIVNNSNSPWVNSGTFTTDKFKVLGGSTKVFNNCRLTVTERFIIGGDGSFFILNGDASVIAEDFDWNGDAYFWMGANSLLLVNDSLKSNNVNDDGKGFHQYGDDFAVISANAITTDNVDGQGRICLYGNIYVDANEMFDLKYVEGISKNNNVTEGNVQFTNKQFTAPVPDAWKTETTCRPAYNPGEQREDEVAWYYYAFEDLGTTDDFDFNDVIIRVSAPVDNVSTVQLVAAGGTLATTVLYNEQVFNATEVHELFGTTPSNSGMVNTGNGPEKKFVTLGTVTLTANDDPADLPFGISAQGTNGQLTKVTHSVENIGKAPLVIVVAGYPSGDNAGRWFWPTERTMISDAYTDFGAWGANASSYQNWYTNYDSNKVYQWNSSKEE